MGGKTALTARGATPGAGTRRARALSWPGPAQEGLRACSATPPPPPVMWLQAQPVARIRARISPPSFQNPVCRVRGCHRNLAALGGQGWLLGGVSPPSPSLSPSPKGPGVQGQGLPLA